MPWTAIKTKDEIVYMLCLTEDAGPPEDFIESNLAGGRIGGEWSYLALTPRQHAAFPSGHTVDHGTTAVSLRKIDFAEGRNACRLFDYFASADTRIERDLRTDLERTAKAGAEQRARVEALEKAISEAAELVGVEGDSAEAKVRAIAERSDAGALGKVLGEFAEHHGVDGGGCCCYPGCNCPAQRLRLDLETMRRDGLKLGKAAILCDVRVAGVFQRVIESITGSPCGSMDLDAVKLSAWIVAHDIGPDTFDAWPLADALAHVEHRLLADGEDTIESLLGGSLVVTAGENRAELVAVIAPSKGAALVVGKSKLGVDDPLGVEAKARKQAESRAESLSKELQAISEALAAAVLDPENLEPDKMADAIRRLALEREKLTRQRESYRQETLRAEDKADLLSSELARSKVRNAALDKALESALGAVHSLAKGVGAVRFGGDSGEEDVPF